MNIESINLGVYDVIYWVVLGLALSVQVEELISPNAVWLLVALCVVCAGFWRGSISALIVIAGVIASCIAVISL